MLVDGDGPDLWAPSERWSPGREGGTGSEGLEGVRNNESELEVEVEPASIGLNSRLEYCTFFGLLPSFLSAVSCRTLRRDAT